MIKIVEKKPKVAICIECKGTGIVKKADVNECCRQCEGSGRVIVSAKMKLDIRPFKTYNF